MNDSRHDFDKQTEDLLLPKFYFIELLQEGSFPKANDQVNKTKNKIAYKTFPSPKI